MINLKFKYFFYTLLKEMIYEDTAFDYFLNDYIEDHEEEFEGSENDFEACEKVEKGDLTYVDEYTNALNTYEREDVLNVEGEEELTKLLIKNYKDKANSETLTNIKDTHKQFFKTFNFCELTKERKLREEVITLKRIIITWTDTRFYKDFKEAIYKKYDVSEIPNLADSLIIAISKNKSYYTTYQEKEDLFELSNVNGRFLYNEIYPVWLVDDL